MPNTKIVVTLGPASDEPAVLRRILELGANVIRLNASHGTQEDHARRIRCVREVAAQLSRQVGILLDLQGPKIRLGKFEGGSCRLKTGGRFAITVEPVLGDCHRASTGYANFARDVRPGDRVLVADGTVELRALNSDGTSVELEVVEGGTIGDNKGINLPGVRVSTPAVTEKDLSDVRFGLEHGVDLVALSFVRCAGDVRRLREVLSEAGRNLPIVAKIEKPEGWDDIDEILFEADGVMVARGDLGVEVALERVPMIQKSIIRKARERGRFVITATQMLESMVSNPVPTRAEVSDVANAILDGTDAVMLSAETSVGRYPVEAVRTMARIAAETERAQNSTGPAAAPFRVVRPSIAELIARSVYHAASDPSTVAVVVFTSSGSSARLIARWHPRDPIYAVTPNEEVARQLAIQYGVTPILADDVASTDEMLSLSDKLLVEGGYLKRGDCVVFVAGQPIGHPGTTNFMKLHRLGETSDVAGPA